MGDQLRGTGVTELGPNLEQRSEKEEEGREQREDPELTARLARWIMQVEQAGGSECSLGHQEFEEGWHIQQAI